MLVEQLIKDTLQIGFSFFVAAYLLIVMTNLMKELREKFISLQKAIDQLIIEVRELRTMRERQSE